MNYGGKDHETADKGCPCRLAVRLQACVCWLSLQPIGCMSAFVCDVQHYCSCSCHYISVMPHTCLMPLLKVFNSVIYHKSHRNYLLQVFNLFGKLTGPRVNQSATLLMTTSSFVGELSCYQLGMKVNSSSWQRCRSARNCSIE